MKIVIKFIKTTVIGEVELLKAEKIKIKTLKTISENNKLYCDDNLILILFFIHLIVD